MALGSIAIRVQGSLKMQRSGFEGFSAEGLKLQFVFNVQGLWLHLCPHWLMDLRNPKHCNQHLNSLSFRELVSLLVMLHESPIFVKSPIRAHNSGVGV